MKYKNILWIDDIDDKDFGGEPASDPLKSLNEGKAELFFGRQAENVELVENYMEALKKLGSSSERYDLVVFDINMEQGAEYDEFNNIKEKLKTKRVKVEDLDDSSCYKEFERFKRFGKKAGMYLYLFLLNCGYPNERMVILTGNSLEEPKKFLEEAHLDAEEIRILEKVEISGKDWIDKLYEKEYYRIRRLVYKACEYWKEKLDGETNIAFNEIYFGKDKDIQLDKDSFLNMLDRIELLFPVKQPSKPNNVYYQALQVASMFHEESAKINKLDNGIWKENRCYHQSVRNFRNWSSHNKFNFNANKLDGRLFAYIFCMALRTYFMGDDKKKQFENEIEYEKEYFGNGSCEEVNYDGFQKKYINTWERHFEKVQGENAQKLGYEGIDELLLDSGRCKNGYMEFADAVVNILGEWMKKEGEGENKDGKYTYTITYQWNDIFKKEEFKEKLQEMYKDGQKNRWWEYYAYELFIRLSEE